MLSDEERKAVDKIKTLIQYLNVWKENFTIVPEDVKYLVTILNLIEKQSKEIEELNKENTRQHELIGNIHQKWKDKIKAKIEELDKQEKEVLKGIKGQDRYAIKQEYMHKRSALQSLLEKE